MTQSSNSGTSAKSSLYAEALLHGICKILNVKWDMRIYSVVAPLKLSLYLTLILHFVRSLK